MKADQSVTNLIAELTPRLNGWEHNAENWLSMRPETKKHFKVDKIWTDFGEFNEHNGLEGRGIRVWNCGQILIGHFFCDALWTGNYILIWNDGAFRVGEFYLNDGGH